MNIIVANSSARITKNSVGVDKSANPWVIVSAVKVV